MREMRFWKHEGEHSQFSNSRRVSFCLASVETRDCRLLIVVDDGDGDFVFVVAVQPPCQCSSRQCSHPHQAITWQRFVWLGRPARKLRRANSAGAQSESSSHVLPYQLKRSVDNT